LFSVKRPLLIYKNEYMKIILVNPPSPFLIDDAVFPSLGLLYISSYLKENGFNDIELIDLNGKHEFPDKLEGDVIGFYSNTPQFSKVVEICKRMKNINQNKKCVYVIGGPHVSGRPEDSFEDFDVAVVGEGEQAMLDIVDKVSRGEQLGTKVVSKEVFEDINMIPFPDRELIDIKGYHYFIEGQLTTTLITSRGCPFGCVFCANNVWGKKIRMRSAENIFDEVSMLIDKYGYRSFMFFDDTMTLNKNRMKNICRFLEPLKIIY